MGGAIKLDPNHAKAHYNLGPILAMKGDFDGTIKAYESAIKHDPNDADAHYNLGVAMETKRDFYGVIKVYEGAIKVDPNHAINVTTALVWKLMMLKSKLMKAQSNLTRMMRTLTATLVGYWQRKALNEKKQ